MEEDTWDTTSEILYVYVKGSKKHCLFYCEQDFFEYLFLLQRMAKRKGVEVLAYGLLEREIHLVVKNRNVHMGSMLTGINEKYDELIKNRSMQCRTIGPTRVGIVQLKTPDQILKKVCDVHLCVAEKMNKQEFLNYKFCSFREYLTNDKRIVAPEKLYGFFPKENFMAVHSKRIKYL